MGICSQLDLKFSSPRSVQVVSKDFYVDCFQNTIQGNVPSLAILQLFSGVVKPLV
jgi:hypothetical protein